MEKTMRKVVVWSVLLLLLGGVGPVGAEAEQAVPVAVSSSFPKIKAALDDGFYSLAELQAADVLSEQPNPSEELEAVLLMAHALWGQERYTDLLDLLKGYGGEPGVVYWRVRGLYELGRYTEALDEFIAHEAVLADSRFAAAALRLRGHVELRLEKPESAVKSFLQFEIQFPEDVARTQNQFDLATAYQAQKKLPEAVSVLKKLMGGEEARAARVARLKLGHLLYTQGAAEHYPEARILLTELAQEAKTPLALKIDAYVDLAALEEKAEQRKAAGDALKKAISLSPDARQRVPLKLSLARLLLQDVDTAGALKLLEECQVEPPSPEIAAELQLEKAGALLLAKQYEAADRAYQAYLEFSGDASGRARAYLGKGLTLWQLARYMEATAAFDKALVGLKEPADRAEALFKGADSFFKAKRYGEAAKRYRRFVNEFSGHELVPNALYQWGLALNEAGSDEQARKTFEQLEKQFPESAFAEQAALGAADIDFSMREWESALERYQRIEQVYTNAAAVAFSQYRRGEVLYRLRQYKAAQSAFELVLKNYPAGDYAPISMFMRGRCLYDLGQHDEAVKACQTFIEKYPESEWRPMVLYWLAEQYFNTKRYADAEKLFLKIVAEYKQNELAPEALYWAGRAAAAQGNFREAVEQRYSALLKAYPDSAVVPVTRFSQGDALSELGRFSNAIFVYEQIIKNYPDSDLVNEAWGRKGDCQFSLGKDNSERYTESIQSYQAIMDRPSARWALKMEAEYKMGRSYLALGQSEKAHARFMSVVYTFLNEAVEHSERTILWFTRAATMAADIKAQERDWPGVVKIYERVIEAGVPASADAQKRIEEIKLENFSLFQQLGGR